MKLSLLKNRNFALLMAGKSVSLLGSDMQQFALSLYVLSITGSATIFGSMLAISILPRLLLSPVAGVFGDWFDRKRSIVTMDLVNGILIGSYAVFFHISGSLSITSIYLLVILLEITEIFFGAAMSAVLPSIVEKEDLFEANSLKSMITSLFNMMAPLLAAGLYSLLGIFGVLVINAVSFVLSSLSEMFIEIPKYNKRPEKINIKEFKKDFMVGIRLIRDSKIIKNIIGLGMVLNFCLVSLFSVGLIFIIKETYGGSDIQVGLFSTVLSFSMLITPILLSGFAKKVHIGKLLIYSFFIVSLLIMAIGLISGEGFTNQFSDYMIPFGLLLGISFIIGIFVTLANISLGTLFDSMVPKEIMGRTSSVMGLAMTIAAPVGQVALGAGIDAMDPMIPMMTIGVVMLLAVIYYKKVFIEKVVKTDEAA
jgi:MFS family permease